MPSRRWNGPILAVAVFLVAFGVALATTFFQVSRQVDSVVSFQAVEVLADENLGLYHDQGATDPVDELEFRVPNIPGVPRASGPELVYIVNHSVLRPALVEPCRAVISDGQRVGFINAEVVGLDGQPRGIRV